MKTTTSCSWARARLSHFVDGQLPNDERHELQQHLQRCPACRREFRGILRLGQRVRAVPTRLVPDGAAQRANLEARRRRQDSLAGLRDGQGERELQVSRPRAAAAAAALLALGLWAGWSIAVAGGSEAALNTQPATETHTQSPIAKEEPDPGALRPMRPGRRIEGVAPSRVEEEPPKIDAVPASRDR